MPRGVFHKNQEGRRFDSSQNRQIEQKMSYQELLQENMQLKKENNQLSMLLSRYADQLTRLHVSLEQQQHEENEVLRNTFVRYNLTPFQRVLMPLLNSFEFQVGDISASFNNIYDDFCALEKKYEEVAAQNETLKDKLIHQIQENIKVCSGGAPEPCATDFSQMIMEQVLEKQKVIVEENVRFEREIQRLRGETERLKREIGEFREQAQESRSKLKEKQLMYQQMESESRGLKDNTLELKIQCNEVEAEKRKLTKDLERASAQLSQVARERDTYFSQYQQMKKEFQSTARYSSEHSMVKTKLGSVELQQNDHSDETHRKLVRLQKEWENVVKERNRYKQSMETEKIRGQELGKSKEESMRRIQVLEAEKFKWEVAEATLKKAFENLSEKATMDASKIRKENNEAMEVMRVKYNKEIQGYRQKITELEGKIDQINTLRGEELRNLQNKMRPTKEMPKNKKQSERMNEKLKEKINVTQQLFREQLNIVQQQNSYLKKQNEGTKFQLREKIQQLRKMKSELERTKKQLSMAVEERRVKMEQIKRVRDEYEVNLKQKEKMFDMKISQIRIVVQDAQKRRKQEKQRSQQALRDSKRIAEQIRATYEQKIRNMESQAVTRDRGNYH